MLVIGLTGGIGSGKSTVSALFAEHGVPVIDADEIARALVVPGEPALAAVVAAFGDAMLLPDGSLDRARLRRLVLHDSDARKRLEAILHPRVRAEIRRRTRSLEAPYCILSIPLLVETGRTGDVHRVLVVDCPEALQRDRVAARSQWSPSEIDAVIAAQASRAQRLAVADDVVVNDRNLASLRTEVRDLHHRYLELSAHHDAPH